MDASDKIEGGATAAGDAGGDGNSVADAAVASGPSSPPAEKRQHKKRKASKGRLKKLWRRAAGPPPGISSRSEWLELMDLHSDWKSSRADCEEARGGGGVAIDQEAMLGLPPGPSVVLAPPLARLRDFSRLESWQTSEGSDHRDVILNLLFRDGQEEQISAALQSKKKKRKMEPDLDRPQAKPCPGMDIPALPSWSGLSNLGGVGGVAVIQVDISGGEKDSGCPLMPSHRIKDTTDNNLTNVWSSLLMQTGDSGEEPNGNDGKCRIKRTISAACRVKLFQGNRHPRSVSDVLMYLPPPRADAVVKTKAGAIDIHGALNEMLLKPKQLRSEGFLVASAATAPGATVSDETLGAKRAIRQFLRAAGGRPSVGDLRKREGFDALDLVGKVSVSVCAEDEDSTCAVDEFSGDEHYVASFSSDPVENGNETETRDHANEKPNVFSLDCEMVQTNQGPELARVSIIMFTGEGEKSVVVLDELVKPRRRVLNYLTEYSGITSQMLKNVTTRIEDIQILCLSYFEAGDILVGHSLENDLRALRFAHTKIVDTSVVFHGVTGRKFSLKHLTNVLLQRKIQRGCGSSGHCSVEDAEAALVLALRRARRGGAFRLKENARRESILRTFQRVNREAVGDGRGSDGDEAGSLVGRNEGCCVCVGPNEWISSHAQSGHGAHHALACETITNAAAMAVPSWLSSDAARRAGLLWASLRCEGRGKGGRIDWSEDAKRLDEILRALVDRVPFHTPILLIFQRNHKKSLSLHQQRKAARNPKAACGWSSLQEEEWERYMEQSRHCEAIWLGSASP